MAAPRPRTLRELWPELALVTFGIALRVAMNASYDVRWGYDFDDHLAYIRHFVDGWSWMPLGDARAAYHPPLYFALAALLARAGATVQQLGWISITAGCARLMLILYGVERWLPESRAARLFALGIAAILPASVQLDGMLTNEALEALLGTAATLAAARYFVAGDGPRWRWRRAVELGLVVGLALWVKVSAAVIFGAVALVVAIEAWRERKPSRAWPFAAAVVVVALVAGPWFAHCRATYGRFMVTGFDVADARRAEGHLDAPYWRRRPLHFYVAFQPRAFVLPYAPTGLLPRADFWTPLVASTFVDYYNFGYAPYPADLDTPVRGNFKPLRRDVLWLSRASMAGGALVAVAAIAGLVGAWLFAWRRRDWARLAMLLVPVLAVVGQLHFAVKFPIDSEGMVKGTYVQFAAAPLCATFGVAVAWLWRRRRLRALAVVEMIALAAIAAYDVACRVL